MADYIDILKRNNPGIYIEERDNSVFNITPFFEEVQLVVGFSKKGPFNLPVLVISPENFIKIFGNIDYSLERKESYFHRTVLKLLQNGPVICFNIRNINRELDLYNWISLSTASDVSNTQTRSNSVTRFYNTSDGFYKREPDRLNDISNFYNNKTAFNVVNFGRNDVSLLMFKSRFGGFDIPLEDWYETNEDIPDYLHPKDFVSDYMLEVYAIEGSWNDYNQLSLDPKWSRYFTSEGVRRDSFDRFIAEKDVNVIQSWQVCLIPYFRDKSNKNLHLPTVINADVNETGVLVSYDLDKIEQDFRNGSIDLIGDNLTNNPQSNINFLSYNKDVMDLFLVDEKVLDQAGNSFGDHRFNLGSGRTQLKSEGYVYDCRLKPSLISTTTKLDTVPLESGAESYVILNGKEIPLNNIEVDTINVYDKLRVGEKFTYTVVVTDDGVEIRTSNAIPINSVNILPEIDAEQEIVLGYYVISQPYENHFDTETFSVAIDENGFVSPYDNINGYNSKISFIDNVFKWQQTLNFENIINLDQQDYRQLRVYHLWYWLNLNLIEGTSIIIDKDNNKQKIDTVRFEDVNSDSLVTIALENIDIDIQDVDNTYGGFGLYIRDLEFITQNQSEWRTQIEPYDTEGIIGVDSLIYEAFFRGDINSDDPFFWLLAKEEDVIFQRSVNNYIILTKGPNNSSYNGKKIIISGSQENDAIYDVISTTTVNGEFALVVQQDVTAEMVSSVNIFDASNPKIVNLFEIDGVLRAKVDIYEGDVDELYDRAFGKSRESQWEKTLQISVVVDSTTIMVNADRYADSLELGNYLLGDNKLLSRDEREVRRNWTRIIELVRFEQDPNLLIVRTDSPIKLNRIENVLQTKHLIPIDRWVETLDFKVLKGYKVRPEQIPDGTDSRLQSLLNVVSKNTRIAKGLSSDKLEWRYLIDSFGGGLTTNSKKELAELAQLKQQAHAFINMPSMKSFRKSSSTLFTDDGYFNTKLLLQGGNRVTNGGVRFSLTTTAKSHCTYGFPNVVVFEKGRYFSVPPAAFIASVYMKKHNISRYESTDVVAGINEGRVTDIGGLEDILSDEQLNDLNNLRVLSIASYNNQFYYLHNENTAEVSTSSLGYVHNRELLIEIERELKDVFSQYQWRFFSDENQEKIIELANGVCERYRRSGDLNDYFNSFQDDENLQDAQIAVVNTYLEPVGAMGTILGRVTINSTGQLGS